MRVRSDSVIAIVLALLTLASCTSSRVSAEMRQAVILQFGRAAQFPSGLTVAFTGVVSDSRCPVGVTCIQKGDVVVELTASLRGTEKAIRLSLDSPSNRVELLGHVIELLGVTPQATAPPKPADRHAVKVRVNVM